MQRAEAHVTQARAPAQYLGPSGACRATRLALVLLLAATGAVGCAPTRFEATSDIPPPLVEKVPVTIGVHLPLEFREKLYEEKRERGGGEYAIGLGKAQAAAFMRVLEAMFEKVVTVSSPAAGAATDPAIRGTLEPVLEDYAFVTPTDSGTSMYAASLRYTIRLYAPGGDLKDSWTFTGYGSQPSSSFPGAGDDALREATRLALRDAAAKLAAELREQAVGRGLMLESGRAVAPAEVAAPPPSPAL